MSNLPERFQTVQELEKGMGGLYTWLAEVAWPELPQPVRDQLILNPLTITRTLNADGNPIPPSIAAHNLIGHTFSAKDKWIAGSRYAETDIEKVIYCEVLKLADIGDRWAMMFKTLVMWALCEQTDLNTLMHNGLDENIRRMWSVKPIQIHRKRIQVLRHWWAS